MVAPDILTAKRRVVDEESFAKRMEKAYFTREQVEEARSRSLGMPWGFQEVLREAMYHRQKKHGCLGHQGRRVENFSIRPSAWDREQSLLEELRGE